jgi:hypothetical protein
MFPGRYFPLRYWTPGYWVHSVQEIILMAGYLFNLGAYQLQSGAIDWENDTIKARLSETTETPDRDANVMTGIGLAITDVVVTGAIGPTLDDVNDRVGYTSDNIVFPSVTRGPEVDKMVLYKFVTNDADSIPIAVVGIRAAAPNGGGIGVNVTAVGLFYTQQ